MGRRKKQLRLAKKKKLVAVALRKASRARIGGTRDYRMTISTDSVLRAGIAGHGEDHVLTLDPRFQGLPDTAHGGTVLAAFHAVAGRVGPQAVRGIYRKRVPLGTPLRLSVARRNGEVACRLLDDGDAMLVEGTVHGPGETLAPAMAPGGGEPLPVSSTCFACGIDNALGLRARLFFDDTSVWTRFTPRESLATPAGTLAPVALTALLDEAAFWLGALASGEAGMTTELAVTLHRPIAHGADVVVAAARARTRPRGDDPRFWETEITAADAAGDLVAEARITFVAVRGAARRLVSGLLALNPPDVLHRVFPAYAR
jgi:acyl-coenzyme A thioesterase PaaI-like protein